tara:strand:+ start:5982 stop:6200 length:219 start_codon:yes stop_codon:yes gene_type:complete
VIDESIIVALRGRYSDIHPLIFHRSIEKAETAGELFDILDTFENEYPQVWDEDTRRWAKSDDLFQSRKYEPI